MHLVTCFEPLYRVVGAPRTMHLLPSRRPISRFQLLYRGPGALRVLFLLSWYSARTAACDLQTSAAMCPVLRAVLASHSAAVVRSAQAQQHGADHHLGACRALQCRCELSVASVQGRATTST